MDSSQIKPEIARIVALAKETDYLVTGLPSLDGSGSNIVPVDVLRQIVTEVSQKAPTTTFMLVVAGDNMCQGIVHCSDSNKSADEWLEASGFNLTVPSSDANGCDGYGELKCESPIRMKDEMISRAFAFLRKNNLLHEESDDELPIFDF